MGRYQVIVKKGMALKKNYNVTKVDTVSQTVARMIEAETANRQGRGAAGGKTGGYGRDITPQHELEIINISHGYLDLRAFVKLAAVHPLELRTR